MLGRDNTSRQRCGMEVGQDDNIKYLAMELDRLHPTSDQYLQMVLMCAITLAHAIGHLINSAQLDRRARKDEPREKAVADLGAGLISWPFGCWLPESIGLGKSLQHDYAPKVAVAGTSSITHPVRFRVYYNVFNADVTYPANFEPE